MLDHQTKINVNKFKQINQKLEREKISTCREDKGEINKLKKKLLKEIMNKTKTQVFKIVK